MGVLAIAAILMVSQMPMLWWSDGLTERITEPDGHLDYHRATHPDIQRKVGDYYYWCWIDDAGWAGVKFTDTDLQAIALGNLPPFSLWTANDTFICTGVCHP